MRRLKETRIIFDDELDFDSAKENLIERYIDSDMPVEDITDDDVWEEARFLNENWFEDEKSNLNKTLDGDILVLADIGTWRGRFAGHKVIGNNLNEVLQYFCDSSSYLRVEYDGVNVVSSESHHDSSNSYIFREIKPTAPDSFLEKLEFNEPITDSEIKRHTRSLRPYVKEIFGW